MLSRLLRRRVPYPNYPECTPLALRPHRLRLVGQQLPEHILQNPAVRVIERFLRRVDAHQCLELDRILALRSGRHMQGTSGREVLDHVADAGNLEYLLARQFQ